MNTDKNYTTISLLLIDMLEVVILLITYLSDLLYNSLNDL